MINIEKYSERIDSALKKLEKNKVLIKEAYEIKKTKKELEEEVISLKKSKLLSEELIDQAINEIESLKENSTKKEKSSG